MRRVLALAVAAAACGGGGPRSPAPPAPPSPPAPTCGTIEAFKATLAGSKANAGSCAKGFLARHPEASDDVFQLWLGSDPDAAYKLFANNPRTFPVADATYRELALTGLTGADDRKAATAYYDGKEGFAFDALATAYATSLADDRPADALAFARRSADFFGKGNFWATLSPGDRAPLLRALDKSGEGASLRDACDQIGKAGDSFGAVECLTAGTSDAFRKAVRPQIAERIAAWPNVTLDDLRRLKAQGHDFSDAIGGPVDTSDLEHDICPPSSTVFTESAGYDEVLLKRLGESEADPARSLCFLRASASACYSKIVKAIQMVDGSPCRALDVFGAFAARLSDADREEVIHWLFEAKAEAYLKKEASKPELFSLHVILGNLLPPTGIGVRRRPYHIKRARELWKELSPPGVPFPEAEYFPRR